MHAQTEKNFEKDMNKGLNTMKTMKKSLAALLMVVMMFTCTGAMAEANTPVALETMYGENIETAAAALGMNKTQEESDEILLTLYENEDVMLGGHGGSVVDITYLGGDYTLCGLQMGMTMAEAKAALDAQGIVYEENTIVEIEVPTLDFVLPGNADAAVCAEFDNDILVGVHVNTEIEVVPVEEAAPAKQAAKPAAVKEKGYIRLTGSVNFRKNADKDSKKVGTIASGIKLKYTEYQKDNRGVKWYKVSFKGKTGWVSSKYATKISEKEFKKDEGHSGSSKPGKEKKANGVIRLTGKVNVRKKPDKNSKSLETFAKGSELKFTATAKDNRGVTWYKVTADGITGWISSKNAKKIK